MEHDLSEAVPQQVLRQAILMLSELRWDSRCRKGCREVKMETSVDPLLAGDCCSAFRILHEYHGADRRNGAAKSTVENAPSRLPVASPIVSVHDEKTGPAPRSVAVRVTLT